MKQDTSISTPLSVEEYIRLELKSDTRHEFVNGQLIKKPGKKAINNKIAGHIYILLCQYLLPKGYEIFNHDVKVANFYDRSKYFYPDVFVTREPESEHNQYIKYEPELIVEVISPSTHITDTVDKYLAYTAIPSLKYYLIVEPETVYVTCYSKDSEGKWEAMSYVRKENIIQLPALDIALPLEEVYKV